MAGPPGCLGSRVVESEYRFIRRTLLAMGIAHPQHFFKPELTPRRRQTNRGEGMVLLKSSDLILQLRGVHPRALVTQRTHQMCFPR